MRINLENAKIIKTVKGFGGSACWWSPQVKSEKQHTRLQIFFTAMTDLE